MSGAPINCKLQLILCSSAPQDGKQLCLVALALHCMPAHGSIVQAQRLQLSEAAAGLEAAEVKATQHEADLAEAKRAIASLEEDLLATEQAGQGESSTAQGTSHRLLPLVLVGVWLCMHGTATSPVSLAANASVRHLA